MVVERLGCSCRWLYKRELLALEESEGYMYTMQNQFGDRFYSVAASTRLIQVLMGFTRSTGLQFSLLIKYLRKFVGFLPPRGSCDSCYTTKHEIAEWLVPERGALPLTMGVLTVGAIPVGEEDMDLFEDSLSKTTRFQSRQLGDEGVEEHFPVCRVPGQVMAEGSTAPYACVPEEVVFTTGSGSFETPFYAAAGSGKSGLPIAEGWAEEA